MLQKKDSEFLSQRQYLLRKEIDDSGISKEDLRDFRVFLKGHVLRLRERDRMLVILGLMLVGFLVLFRYLAEGVMPDFVTLILAMFVILYLISLPERGQNHEWAMKHEEFILLIEREIDRETATDR